MASWAEAQYVIDELKESAKTENPTGIPPNPPTISVIPGEGQVQINIQPPTTCDVTVNGAVVSRGYRIRLVRKLHPTADGNVYSFPQNIDDGEKTWDFYIYNKESAALQQANLGKVYTFLRNSSGTNAGDLSPMEFVDNNLQNDRTYLYRAFCQSDHGVWQVMNNIAPTDRPSFKDSETRTDIGRATPTKTYIWGFDENFVDGNPATRITYPNDVVNKYYQKAMTNSDNGNETVGDWKDFLIKHLKNRPFMVGKNGKANYGLCVADYSKSKKNNMDYNDDNWNRTGAVSDYNNLNYNGGAFAWINKIYMKETYASDSKSRHVRFCNKKLDGYKAIGFLTEVRESVNVDGIVTFQNVVKELEGLWIPMGYTDNSGRVLVAGTKPSQSKTTAEQKAIIDNSGFGTEGAKAVFFGGPIINVLRDLEYMIFKTTDIQKAAGYGRSNVSATDHLDHVINNENVKGWTSTGSENDIGNTTTGNLGFKGTAMASNALNKMFHSQVLGSYQCWMRDPYTILVNGNWRLSPYYNYSLTAAGYKQTNIQWNGTGSEQYMHQTRDDNAYDFGSNPASPRSDRPAATSSTYLCDAIWWNAEGTRIAFRLGAEEWDVANGPSCISFTNEPTINNPRISFSTLLLPPVGYSPFATAGE